MTTPPTGIDPAQLKLAVDLLPKLAPDKQDELAGLLEGLLEDAAKARCQTEFMPFVHRMWPAFIGGRHHAHMADVFERIANGTLKRVCISMAPRHTKSEFGSYLFPAWFLGRFPHKKVIQASHTAELSVGFGRKVRNLVGSKEYQEVFPDVGLRTDSKAAGRWETSKGGEYFAIGVGGAMTGKGADLLILDDVHNEQEAALAVYDPSVFDKVYEWYTSGPRQRLQPGGAIIMIQTRWAKNDLIGRVLEDQAKKPAADQWEVIEFPAIMPSGTPLWPEFWPLKELLATKANIAPAKWNAQYMQSPTGEEGAIIKRDWWKRWEGRELPGDIEFIIQAWDTAGRKTQRADYSVCTTWGVFRDPNDRPNVILMDLWRDRVEYPELKRMAKELYARWEPDSVIIEAKNAGDVLFQELRRVIPVQGYTPSRGEDKIVRANGVADLFASGMVWAPDERLVPGVDELIEECASFPNAAHDDQLDSTVLALLRFRQGNFIRLDSDDDEDDPTFDPQLKADYYL